MSGDKSDSDSEIERISMHSKAVEEKTSARDSESGDEEYKTPKSSTSSFKLAENDQDLENNTNGNIVKGKGLEVDEPGNDGDTAGNALFRDSFAPEPQGRVGLISSIGWYSLENYLAIYQVTTYILV